MFTTADLSVVIPSYNSSHTILSCLESLYHQVEAPGEVIVVDSSEDDTLGLAQRTYQEVRGFRFSRRTFPGPARNKGVTLAQGKIVAFTDADCITAPDWAARIVAQHTAGHKIVGGAVELGNPDSSLSWAGHLMEFREFLPHGQARRMVHVPTCNISYRRELIETYGGFPDSYYPHEDLLFNYLLNRSGYSVWFDPAIRVRHFCRETPLGFLSHQHRIGRVTRVTLSRTQMEGSPIARRPKVAWCAAPALGILKYVRTCGGLFAYSRWQAIKRPDLLLVLMLGSIWWARGFSAGARTGLSGVRGVIDPEEDIFIMLGRLDYGDHATHES